MAKARVVVVNAQSGWGKSSFARKIIDTARKRGGFGTCIDSRTADGPAFVCAAILSLASKRGATESSETSHFRIVCEPPQRS